MGSLMATGPYDVFSQWNARSSMNDRYTKYSGYLYSAIHAIAKQAAGQPVRVGRTPDSKEDGKSRGLTTKQKTAIRKMTLLSVKQKAENDGIEVLEDHPLIKALDHPNAVQGRWQFVYSFMANLCLTGWSYVVSDADAEGRPEMWSVPSSWITPVHDDGPFSSFKMLQPGKPASQAIPLKKDQVSFAHLPDPSNPLSALAPSSSQDPSIRISGHIDNSREKFFENGIFPSVIVTVGKDPMPGAEGGGVRPRLTAAQRRQLNAVIRKTMGGVANYGNPAIVDGMIESITRFSLTDQEMGWDKSDASVRAAILGAYGVHPFILGREISVGGWAQATIIRQLFYDNVNTYLNFLGEVVTGVIGGGRENNRLAVWWEACEAVDPTQQNSMIRFARQNNDISQDEFRSILGLAPDEDRNQQVLEKSTVTPIITLLDKVSQGGIENTQAIALMEGLGVPTDMAKRIAGPKKKPPVQPPAVPGAPGQPPIPPGQQPKPGQPAVQQGQPEEEEEEITTEQAAKMLKEALGELRKDTSTQARSVASMVLEMTESKHLANQHNQQSHAHDGMGETKRDADGKLTLSDGKPLPDHIPKNIPPAWKEVMVAMDPKAELLVKGKDAKGRYQSVYSKAHWAEAAESKFARANEIRAKEDQIRKEIEKDAKSKDPKTRDSAACLRLIQHTGLRPGSEKDTGAEKQAYGATTIQGKHVVVKGDKVRLRFVGKKGVDLDIEVTDPVVKADLIARKSTAGPSGKLYNNTGDSQLLAYAKDRDGGGFKVKDFRTARGTSEAVEVIKKMKAPKTEKEYKKAVKEVATAVSKKLGNTPTVAQQSYIDAAVFSVWRIK